MNSTIATQNYETSARILCWYMNATNKMQIARITNIPHWYFERMVFPGERLLFEALPSAELEVCRTEETGEVACDRISCARLQVEEAGTAD